MSTIKGPDDVPPSGRVRSRDKRTRGTYVRGDSVLGALIKWDGNSFADYVPWESLEVIPLSEDPSAVRYMTTAQLRELVTSGAHSTEIVQLVEAELEHRERRARQEREEP